jgi:hypothetical protein
MTVKNLKKSKFKIYVSFGVQKNSVSMEFRGIPWNSAEFDELPRHGIPHNSAEFSVIPHNIRNIRKSKNYTEFRVDGIPWTPY